MPITVWIPPEPLAGAPGFEADTNSRLPDLAESQARHSLYSILQRYCNREIAGRSILIAGHRGAGKTTLVKGVIQKLRQDAFRATTVSPGAPPPPFAIPLYVQIHGPDLLGGESVLGLAGVDEAKSPPAANSPSSSAPDPASNPKPESNNDASKMKDRDEVAQAHTSLRVLTIALHRAFATDLGWAFERRVSEELNREALPNSARARDLRELAAQLRLDFDDLIDTDTLRWMWHRAGFLDDGVLRPNSQAVAKDYFSRQGLLEIVAASCVSDSFMRGVAKVDEQDSSKTEAEFKQAYEIEKAKDRKEIVNTVGGIVAGLLAGAGVAIHPGGSSASNGIMGGLVFIATSVLTTVLLNYTSLRSRTRSRSRQRNIQWDRSVASLDLMLPLAISRILDSGRAPIFVIDELDKVNDVEDKLEKLINRLKHIVADRALFCFLVDRPYFEEIQEISRSQPQRKEHTFFSERLYVVSQPAQWREYLLKVLQPAAGNEGDRLQVLALTYLIMGRARMHAIDLRRELDLLPRLPDTNELVDIDRLSLPLYRNMIFMQAVVEYVLESTGVKSLLQRDSSIIQFVYDALYYLLRQWQLGSPPDVSPDALHVYLQARALERQRTSRPVS